MVGLLSDIFGDVLSSEDNEQQSSSETNSDQNADADADASNDGINITTESYSRDEDGEVSYDRTELDTGDTDVGTRLDIDNVIDSMSESMSRSGESDLIDS